MAKKRNYLYEFYEEEILSGIAPELYIDKEMLSKENIYLKESSYKVYKINEDLFYEDDRNQNDLLEFYLEPKNENEDCEELIFEIKENLFFVMVNLTIILSRFQWNTIISKYTTRCLVCDIIIDDPNHHIKTENHVVNLDKHKPLKKFNLHITRLIGDNYHCAVCNEVYDKYDSTHLDSKTHVERMRFATNRATISFYDFDTNDKDNKIKSGFDGDGFYDLNDFTNNNNTTRSFASVVKEAITEAPTLIEHVIGNKTFTIKSDTYHMILRPNGKEFYCMLCIQFGDVNNATDHCKSEEHLKKLELCEIMNIHKEHLIRKVTPKYYHCGTCNNLQLTGDIEAHLERHGMKQENETNQNNKENEAQEINSNKTYEQEIKINENNNKTSENNEHHQNAQTNVYPEHSINLINPNLQNDIIVNNEYPQSAQTNVYPERSINLINPNLHNDIIVNRFNCNIRVSFMSYNLILNRGADFFCLLCNVAFPYHILHYKDPGHIVRLINFPFHPYFGIHLVRMLNQNAHCAICNVMVNVAVIHLHTLNPIHSFLLNKALNPNYNILAMNLTNVVVSPPTNLERSIEPNTLGPSENLQAISTNNSEILNPASPVETVKDQVLCGTEIVSDSFEYDKEDNLNILKEFVNLKLKKSLVAVSYVSYHTLVHTGDGNRYCFICSYKITKSLRGHIESQAHLNRINNCKFIRNYERDLLRQVKLTYHCCICNVLVQKSEIEKHLIWPVHKENAKKGKKIRKRNNAQLNNIINVEFESEDQCFNEKEPQMQLVFKIVCGTKRTNNIGGIGINISPTLTCGRKLLNISWDAWQGITRLTNKVYCHICKDNIFDIDSHLEEDSHKNVVSKPIEKQYLPACIRKINDLFLNCVTCHLVFPNKKKNVSQHLTGKNHLENYEHLLKTAFTDLTLK